ncbi:MAG: c-type cytochrome [Saprospiraceae bacterium]|nr:c-type cytochrome [Saprospiraceae bacterium]
MKKISVVVFFAVLLGFGLSSFVSHTFGDWPVPDKNKKMANPVKSDAASIAEGKTLFGKHCASCHGKTGHGDGSKAAQLKTDPGTCHLQHFRVRLTDLFSIRHPKEGTICQVLKRRFRMQMTFGIL